MTTSLDLGPSPIPAHHQAARPRGVNWSVVLAVVGWLLTTTGTALGAYFAMGTRVTTLEVQRAEDAKRMERLENKIDRILERLK